MNVVLTILVNSVAATALVTAVVWLILRASRNAWNAATREAIWWAVLLVSIMTPLAYTSVRWTGQLNPDRFPAAPAAVIGSDSESLLQGIGAGTETGNLIESGWPAQQGPDNALFPLRLAAEQWPSWIVSAWLLVSLCMLGRLVISYVALDRRKSRAIDAPEPIGERVQQWLQCFGNRQRVRIAASTEISGPVAAGPFRPTILIPARLLQQLEESELDEISLHEAAHLARRDDYWLLLQRIIEAAFVFHPVVRWVTRRIDLEREIACDDFVIRVTGRPRSYAWCLTRLAELSGNIRTAVPATQRRSHLERRVDMLLNDSRKKGPYLLKLRMAGVFVVMAALVSMAANAPGVVVFSAGVNQAESIAVRVPVLVTDSRDRYVSGLEAQHFRIRENGVEQEISEFLPAPRQTANISVGIILNAGGSNGINEVIREAGRRLVSEFSSPADELFIVSGQGALLDSVRLAVEKLRSAQNERKAILIVSDGSGTDPTPYIEDQLKMVAAASEAPIYAISTTVDAPIRPPLIVLTAQTGGRYFAQSDALNKAAVAIRNFYVLTFQSRGNAGDGGYRSLEVEVLPPGGIQSLQPYHRAAHMR